MNVADTWEHWLVAESHVRKTEGDLERFWAIRLAYMAGRIEEAEAIDLSDLIKLLAKVAQRFDQVIAEKNAEKNNGKVDIRDLDPLFDWLRENAPIK